MRILLSFYLICCPFLLGASEKLDDIVAQLDSEDFEVREYATWKLVRDFPGEHAGRYLDMSEKYRRKGKIEVAVRLRRAAKDLFMTKIVTEMEEYQRLFGALGFEYEVHWSEYTTHQWTQWDEHENEIRMQSWHRTSRAKLVGICVTNRFPITEAADKLRKWDVIEKVNGKTIGEFVDNPLNNYGMIIPGKKYELVIRRYKDTDQIDQREMVIHTDKYDLVNITLTGEHKSIYRVDAEKVGNLKRGSWESFLAARQRLRDLETPRVPVGELSSAGE